MPENIYLSLLKKIKNASWFRREGKKGSDGAFVEHLRPGQILHRRGQHADFVYLILSGSCESLKERQDGHAELVATLVPGDAIGEFEGSFLHAESNTTIRAASETTVLQIPRNGLRKLLSRWPVKGDRNVPLEVLHMDESDRAISFRKGKVVCLTTLSDDIPFEFCAGQIAQTLYHETSKRVLRVRLNGFSEGVPLKKWATRQPREENGVFHVELNTVSVQSSESLGNLLDHYTARFDYVLLEVGRHAKLEFLLKCVGNSFSTYAFLKQSAENLFEFNLLFREAKALGKKAFTLKPLVYLQGDEKAHGISQYMEESLHHRVHFYLHSEDTGNGGLSANLRRIGREIGDTRVGLALSSGGARGLAHIGVFQVLEENGLEVDAVAGSSIGAYIAAVWGRGADGRQMEKFAKEIEGYHRIWRLMDIAMPPVRGIMSTGQRVRNRLEKTLQCTHFSDLVRPIRIVSTRLDVLERVTFSGGNVIDAILASIAIPGICVPIELNGVPYVDGGVSDPLPVDALQQMGIHKIIGVNTIPTPETLRAVALSSTARKTLWQQWKARTNALWNPFAPGNGFDNLMRSLHAAQTRLAEISCEKADVVLRPYSFGAHWHDFGNPSRYISLGREVAQRQLPEIQALFHSSYEHQTITKLLGSAA